MFALWMAPFIPNALLAWYNSGPLTIVSLAHIDLFLNIGLSSTSGCPLFSVLDV